SRPSFDRRSTGGRRPSDRPGPASNDAPREVEAPGPGWVPTDPRGTRGTVDGGRPPGVRHKPPAGVVLADHHGTAPDRRGRARPPPPPPGRAPRRDEAKRNEAATRRHVNPSTSE